MTSDIAGAAGDEDWDFAHGAALAERWANASGARHANTPFRNPGMVAPQGGVVVRSSMSIRTQIFGGGAEHRLLKEKQPKPAAEFSTLTDVSISREETRRTNSRDQDRFRLTGARLPRDLRRTRLRCGSRQSLGRRRHDCRKPTPNVGKHVILHLEDDAAMRVRCALDQGRSNSAWSLRTKRSSNVRTTSARLCCAT